MIYLEVSIAYVTLVALLCALRYRATRDHFAETDAVDGPPRYHRSDDTDAHCMGADGREVASTTSRSGRRSIESNQRLLREFDRGDAG